MRRILIATSALALLTSGCLFGRPNKQVDKVEYEDGGETTFKYDDDGHPTDVERDYGGGSSTVWELKWEDGLLVEIEIDSDGSRSTFEVEYDDQGRPEVFDLNGETVDSELTFAYDDNGRLEGYEIKSTNDGTEVSSVEVEIDYADGGAIGQVTSKSTYGDTSSENTIDYEFEGTRLIKSTSTSDDDDETETEYGYDDAGRIETISSTTSYQGEQSYTSETELEFGDDGFLERWTQTSEYEGGEAIESETEVSYNDADARGLDMTPSVLTIFFDMKGGTYNSIVDVKSQVTRFLISQW